MAVSDRRQRIMPSFEDRDKGKPLAYPEAVLLSNTSSSFLRGQVGFYNPYYNLYQYDLDEILFFLLNK